VLLSLYLALKFNLLGILKDCNKNERRVIYSFILFSFSFFLSAIFNYDDFTLTFSQYGKYFTPFILFLILSKYSKYATLELKYYGYLLLTLISIQITLSILKFFLMGVQESIVGSISYVGGGVASILPILGFVLFWLVKKGKFNKLDWGYVFLLLFIGFVSNKRAIWFIFPLIIIVFTVYIPGKLTLKRFSLMLLFAPLVFYLGVRINPTLNSGNQIWGEFDLEYVLNYAKVYSFGENLEQDLGSGRGGATLLLFDNIVDSDNYSTKNILGYGLTPMYTKDYNVFDKNAFGINSKGAVTGFFQSYISAGYLGILLTLFYSITLLFCIRDKNIRNILLAYFLWDYFFYSGLILQTQSLSILLIYIIYISNDERAKIIAQ